MKRWAFLCILLTLTVNARAKDACCPADGQTVAPVANDQTAQAPPAALPEGHPALPEGHPPMPATSAMPEGHPALPDGHPALPGAEEPVTGSLAIKVTQGTADGPSLEGQKVTIRMYSSGQLVSEREEPIGADGLIMLENLTIKGIEQPVVSFEHGGVTFQQVGKPMGAMLSDQLIRLPVYEITDQQPDWSIAMCHVMVRRIEGGIAVTQMLAVQNPSDRAWKGEQTELAEDTANVTFSLQLPAGSQHVTVGQGFMAGSARLERGTLIHTGPIVPGVTQYQFSYLLPAVDGQVDLQINAPSAIGHLMVFVPDDGSDITATGLSESQAMGEGDRAVRVFSVEKVLANQSVSLKLAAPGTAAAGSAEGDDTHNHAQSSTAPSGVPKLAVGAGAAVLAATAAAVAVFRKRASGVNA
ncbi:MAG: hypothetical protein IT445_02025 [Phycisphaeraceae bacterium]|nr:hypothetical protein [Phycisphaeraceae bacterium]